MSDKDWKCSDGCPVCEYAEMLLHSQAFKEFVDSHQPTWWERFKWWLGR